MNDWHRLERVVKWTGLSVNSFALNIGLKRSENLYQIKKGNNGISRDLADLISEKYPSISKGWLLSGEGDMFIEPKKEHCAATGTPYYGIDIVLAVEGDNPPGEPQYHINIPPLHDCDLAGIALSSAMQPEIPAGSTVMLKKWSLESIIPGESYMVVTPKFKGIRVIRLTDNDEHLLLLPRNTNEYDPITVAKNKIIKLYLVHGIIVKRNL